MDFINEENNLHNNYFKDIIGVTKPPEPILEHIYFRVLKDRADYVTTKTIHLSQKEEKTFTNGDKLFSLSLIVNKELITHFLSFGKDLIIEKPKRVRDIIKQELQLASANY